MKKLFLAAAMISGVAASAQSDSTRTKPQLKLSVNYNSNLHYYGRTAVVPRGGRVDQCRRRVQHPLDVTVELHSAGHLPSHSCHCPSTLQQ